jgi:hypothetical protein
MEWKKLHVMKNEKKKSNIIKEYCVKYSRYVS